MNITNIRNSWVVVLGLMLLPLGAAQAQVAVTSADPSSAPQGTISLDVAVNGNGFDNSAAVSFLVTGTTNPGGITVKKVVVRGSKKLIATIEIADTAVVDKFDIEVMLSDGRKGKGTSLFAVLAKNNDPCAVAGLDFPAFAFWKPSGPTQHIHVADSTGKCVRFITTIKSGSGGGGSIQFSYPVGGTLNRGRIVWVEPPAVVGIDFTIDASNNQVSAFPKYTIYPDGIGGYISLSRDGNTLYSNRYLVSGAQFIEKLVLGPAGGPTGPGATVFEAPVGGGLGTMSVNGAETVILADFRPQNWPTPYQLVWIPLDSSNTYHVIESYSEHTEYTPSADSLSDLVVYQNSTSVVTCDALIIKEIGGATVPYPQQPAYGIKPTWMNGMVLADGRVWVRNKGCRYSGTIMQLDPNTGVQTALTSGYDPDGR